MKATTVVATKNYQDDEYVVIMTYENKATLADDEFGNLLLW